MDLGPLLHPVGPRDPSVYWRRRLSVLLVAVVVLVVVIAATSGGGGGDASVAQRPTATGSPPASPAPSAPAGTPASSASPPGATPTPSAAAQAGLAACDVNALQLQARTDDASYPRGAEPKLTLLVTNPGPAPCRADLGSAQLELRVLSGSDRVWSSDDCAPDGAPEPSVLKPGQPWAASLTWSRTRSAPTCPAGQPAAEPGTYRLYARLGQRLSAPAVFHLT